MNKERFKIHGLLFLLVTLLSSCGGGGQGAPPLDTEPAPFIFIDHIDIHLDTVAISNEIQVTGINTRTSIDIIGGSYSIDGGVFTNVSGRVRNNQKVRVRQTSSSNYSISTTSIVTIGGVTETFILTTLAADIIPDDFTFLDYTDVAVNTVVVSEPVMVTGIDIPVTISVSGGEYSIDGAAFTSAGAFVSSGQEIRLRQTSSSVYSTQSSTVLTMGGVVDTFTLTTVAPDVTPDVFTFLDYTDVAVNTIVVSEPVMVAGIDIPVTISVSGGEYSIDGAAFTSAGAFVSSGQEIRLRQTSSSVYSTQSSTVLTMGGVVDTFTLTTVAPDVTPDVFTFLDYTDVITSTVVVSESVLITGIDIPVAISISGGEYSTDGAVFTTIPGVIENNQSVRVRLTSSNLFLTTVTAVLNVNSVVGNFNVRTLDEDTTPDAFLFNNQINVSQNTLLSSNSITVAGIDSLANISIVNGEYSIDGGVFTNANGEVNSGATVVVRQTSSIDEFTTTESTLNIGGVVGVFSVKTGGVDLEAPVATISFPTIRSMTNASSITVRGKAVDNSGLISSVTINGIDAVSTDGFNTWSVTLPLSLGDNVVTVATSDYSLNQDLIAAQVLVERAEAMVSPIAIALDTNNDQLLVVDSISSTKQLIVAVDRSTGNRTLVSGNDVGSGPAFIRIRDIVFDEMNNVAYVVDQSLMAVFAVDFNAGPTYGNRTVITGRSEIRGAIKGTGESGGYIGIDIDISNNRAFVLSDSGELIEVDLDTGDRVLIGDVFISSSSAGIVYDDINNKIYVTYAGTNSILEVSLSGVTTVISSDSVGVGPSLGFPVDIKIDHLNTQLIVVDWFLDAVVSIDISGGLSNGDRTIISDINNGVGINFLFPEGVDIDTVNNQAIVIDMHLRSVVAVNLESGSSAGDRTVITSSRIGEGEALTYPGPMFYDSDTQKTYLVSYASQRVAVLEVNLTTEVNYGDRSVISSSWLSVGAGDEIPNIHDIAFDKLTNKIFVNSDWSLFSIDMNAGANFGHRSRFLNSTSRPRGLAFDENKNLLYVANKFSPSSVFGMDPTGLNAPIELSGDSTGSGPFLGNPDQVLLDAANDRLLLADVYNQAIYSINLIEGVNKGDRQTIADSSTGTGTSISNLSKMALDGDNDRVLVLRNGLDPALISVDLITGHRVEVTSNNVGSGSEYFGASGIGLDVENQRAYLSDYINNAILTVDLLTGQRVFSSM